MDEKYVQALIDTLVEQRNRALDEVAKMRAEIIVLRAREAEAKTAEEPAAEG